RMKAAAERAYQLDEDSPQANLAMGLASESLGAALKYMRHAVEADPSFGDAYHQIGDQIQDFAPELSVDFYRRALALDPRLVSGHFDLGVSLVLLDRIDEARTELASSAGELGQITLDIDERRYDKALDELRKMPG